MSQSAQSFHQVYVLQRDLLCVSSSTGNEGWVKNSTLSTFQCNQWDIQQSTDPVAIGRILGSSKLKSILKQQVGYLLGSHQTSCVPFLDTWFLQQSHWLP